MARERVVVAGASGFIGQGLADALGSTYELVGLTRNAARAAQIAGSSHYEWRECDLFSRKETEEALRGGDYGVYLVHSMIPSAHLTQGDFWDMDLLCADNFARAARHHGLKHIIYISGIIPEGDELSPYSRARREVEDTLGTYGTRVTTLRTAMVLGAGASVSRLLTRLVRRLPVMVLPRWAQSRIAPISRAEMVELIAFVLANPEVGGEIFDVGGGETTSFGEMLKISADLLRRRRRFYSMPVDSMGFSSFWMSLFGGESRALMRPLVENLRHDLLPADRRLQEAAGLEARPLREILAEALGVVDGTEDEAAKEPKGLAVRQDKVDLHDGTALLKFEDEKKVRSVQRLPLPEERSALWVAREYARWLPEFMRPFIRVERDEDDSLRFYMRPIPWPLLMLEFDGDVSREDRHLYWIRGGILASPWEGGRLEFREVLGGKNVLAAIHEFRPRLPWFIYRVTQARIHSFVMHSLARHLQRVIDEA